MILKTPFDATFTDEIEQADEAWFAIALISDDGYNFIQAMLPANCKQHFLVGINLPTSPAVLRNLLNQKEIQSKVFNSKQTFHPKVFIIKKQDGKLVAFVGSSNATNGGFFNNVEVNYKIENQSHCNELIDWFKKLFAQSQKIEDGFLSRYEEIYLKRKRRSSEDKNDLAKVFDVPVPATKAEVEKLDFNGLYFDKDDYVIFSETYWTDYTEPIVKKREIVREKLRTLHYKIYSHFLDYGITDLHPHSNPYYLTSLIEYRKNQNQFERKAIWLHYGKSKDERILYEQNSILMHVRIQIIIRETLLGVWLVIGKDKGSREDREHFQKKLNGVDYQDLIFNLVKELGTGYEILLAPFGSLKSEEITDKQNLIDFLKQDDFKDYFIIKRDYPPNDSRLSKNLIADTMLNEFAKLYQLYDVIRERR